MHGHSTSENTVERIGISYYGYITELKDEDAINTTCNLLGPTVPLTLHTLSVAGASWQEKVEQDGTKLICTRTSADSYSDQA